MTAEGATTAAAGWIIGKILDAVTSPLRDVVSEIELRVAVTDAIERARTRLIRECSSPQERAALYNAFNGASPVLFALSLERLTVPAPRPKDPVALTAHLSAALRAQTPDGKEFPQAMLERIAEAFDAELWSRPPLVRHRANLSRYVVEKHVLRLTEDLIPDSRPAAILARARHGAFGDAAKRLKSAHARGPIVPRTLTAIKEERPQPVSIDDFARGLAAGSARAVVDTGGVGKSTLLALLSEAIMRREARFAAAVLPIEEVAGAGSIFSALTRRDAFLADRVGVDDFAFLVRHGQFAILLDGWNELAREERRAARRIIEQFRGDYPKATIVLASRPSSSPPPIGSNDVYELNRLTRREQTGFVADLVGAPGVDALKEAHVDRRVRDLLGLPFFLSLFAQLPWDRDGAAVPISSASLLNAFIAREFAKPAYLDAPAHRTAEALQSAMHAIAAAMTSADRMQINKADAEAAIRSARAGASPISDAEAADVVGALIDHSLMRAADADARAIRFNHELFRDWFASGEVAAAIAACAGDAETPSRAARRFGDDRRWTGAIELAVEALAGKKEPGTGLERFLLDICGIDSLFAADLLARLSDESWSALLPRLREFLSAWTKETGSRPPLLFMVRTGRPDFADQIWSALASGDDNGRFGGVADGRRFNPRVLGENWRPNASKLTGETRRILIHDLAYYGGEQGLSMAAAAALDDPDAEHFGFVLDELYYRDENELAAAMIGAATDNVWDRWAIDTRFRSLAAEVNRGRLVAALDRVAADKDATLSLRAIVARCDLTGDEPADEVIERSLTLDEASRDHHGRWVETFHKLAPHRLSRIILAKLTAGERAPFRSERYLTALSESDREAVFARMTVLGEHPHWHRDLARFLSRDQLSVILEEYRSIGAQFDRRRARPFDQALYDRSNQLSDLLDGADHDAFVRLLTQTPARSAHDASLLLQRLRRWNRRDDGEERHLAPTGVRLLALAQRVEGWCGIILEAGDVSRGWLADAALGLARLRRRQALPLVKALLDRELDLHAVELEEQKRNPRRAAHGSDTAHMNYDSQFRQAFDELFGDSAREALLSFVGDPRFEIEAARGLTAYAPHSTADIIEERPFGVTAFLIRRRRAALRDRPRADACHPVAAKVLDRIKAIERDETGWRRIRALAPSAAAMDCGPRISELIALIESDPDPRGEVATLTALSNMGHPVKAAWVKPGLDTAEAEYFKAKWRPDNDFYILRPWLSLLAMSDDPLDLAQRLARYPNSLTRWRIRDYLSSLIIDDPETELEAIDAFSAILPDRDNGHLRTEALLCNGTAKAMERLLDDVLNGRTRPHWLYGRGETGPLPHYIEVTPDRLRRLINDVERDSERKAKQARLAELAGGLLAPHSFQAVMDAVDAAPGSGWEGLLHVMLEGQCLQREPVGAMTYEIRQRAVGALRRDLWHRTRDRRNPNPVWGALLARLDEIIIDHGGHPDDPRHPDLSARVPHPASAALLWSSSANDIAAIDNDR